MCLFKCESTFGYMNKNTQIRVCIYIYVSVSVSQVIAFGSLGFVWLKLSYIHDCVLGCLRLGLFSKATKASTYTYKYIYMYVYICIYTMYVCMCV